MTSVSVQDAWLIYTCRDPGFIEFLKQVWEFKVAAIAKQPRPNG